MRTRVTAIVLVLALAAGLAAQEKSGLAGKKLAANGRVDVAWSVEPTRVRAGDSFEVRFDLDVKPKYHVYAPSSPNAAPTFDLDDKKNDKAFALDGPMKGPPGKAVKDPGLGDIEILEGKARFTQKVKVAADAKPGPRALAGALNFQACDEQGCAPDDVAVAGDIIIDAAAVSTSTATVAPPVTQSSGDFVALLWLAVGSGIVTIFLPCTYPMVPITISIFTKGKKLARGPAIARAAIYAGGIVISFTVIGGVIQALLGAAGQAKINDIVTNGAVNLAIGAIFVYFAFSFFGYYDIGLPGPLQRLMDRMTSGSPGEGGVGPATLFLMGLFFVLTSYTCGAPLILGVIAQAATTQAKGAVVIATAVFGATVAAPFFVLALVPSFLKSLPRGGGWFDAFKTVLGFLELAFAFKFLRTTDVAWELHLLGRPVLLGVWVACLGLSAAYLLGWIKIVHEGEEPLEKITGGRLAWALVLLFFAIYLGSGIGGRHLAGQIEAFMLASADQDEVASGPATTGPAKPGAYVFGKLEYGRDLDSALADAKAEKKNVLVMFTGHT